MDLSIDMLKPVRRALAGNKIAALERAIEAEASATSDMRVVARDQIESYRLWASCGVWLELGRRDAFCSVYQSASEFITLRDMKLAEPYMGFEDGVVTWRDPPLGVAVATVLRGLFIGVFLGAVAVLVAQLLGAFPVDGKISTAMILALAFSGIATRWLTSMIRAHKVIKEVSRVRARPRGRI